MFDHWPSCLGPTSKKNVAYMSQQPAMPSKFPPTASIREMAGTVKVAESPARENSAGKEQQCAAESSIQLTRGEFPKRADVPETSVPYLFANMSRLIFWKKPWGPAFKLGRRINVRKRFKRDTGLRFAERLRHAKIKKQTVHGHNLGRTDFNEFPSITGSGKLRDPP